MFVDLLTLLIGVLHRNDEMELIKCFVEYLLHSVINSQVEDTSPSLTIHECLAKFDHRYGPFANLKVGKINRFVKESKTFSLCGESLSQTDLGKTVHKNFVEKRVIIHFDEATKSVNSKMNDIGTLPNECTSIGNRKILPEQSKYAEELVKHLSEFDSRFAFMLICNKLPASNFLSGIANVPWLRVFDFDADSRESGLLSCVEKTVKMKRYFTISTFSDQMQSLSERSTDWCFMKGFSDKPETLSDYPSYQWYCQNKPIFEQHGMDIANFCSCRYMPVFLILWYDVSDDDTVCLDWFLSVLMPYFMAKHALVNKVVFCVDKVPDERSPLHQLITKYQLKDVVLAVPLNNLCNWLSNANVPPTAMSDGIKLPNAATEAGSTAGYVEISEELSWIQQYIEVLPLQNLQGTSSKKDNSFDIGMDFVRGGTVSWIDLAHSKAIKRNRQKIVYDRLCKDIKSDKKKVMSYKIFHSPGGGGTTFARQLLWYLHTEVPCGVVIPHPTFSVAHLLERINFIYDKTQLPVVLLVDGRSDYEVEQLCDHCRDLVVILHVQRCTYKLKTEPNELRGCLLPGIVTQKEADMLANLYSQFAPESTSALKLLSKDASFEEKHMFEFGLTAFNLQFKGVQAYVKGYLNLKNKGFGVWSDLCAWQKVVAYLSLVQFYGQDGLQREVFHHLLKEDMSSFVTLNDLVYSGRQFVVESNRKWKINYYAVAREILHQILSNSSSSSSDTKLSPEARNNLHELVIDFILMLKTAMGDNYSEHIFFALSNIVLRRDYKDVDATDVYERRSSFSQLLEDVLDDEKRIEILKSLTQAFPRHSEYHAHLGRMLNIMGKYSDAEISLQEALTLRIKERKNRGPECPDNVRGRFHHMFGFACRRRVVHKLFSRVKSKELNIPEVMKIVQNAIYHFTEGRKYVTYNRSYGYIGEVSVRLLLAESVHKNRNAYPKGCLEAFNGEMDQKSIQLSEFIRESHSVCDQLLAECHRYSPEAELKTAREFYPCVDKFIMCYQGVAGDQKVWNRSESNISIRRSKIASIKLKHFRKDVKRIPNVDDIKDANDVRALLKNHEETFREVLTNRNPISGVSISFDVCEYLEAIRHAKIQDDYSLMKLLHTVEAWEKRNEMGYATYYLYILYFLLALYYPGYEGNSSYLVKAEELRRKLYGNNQWSAHTPFTREWLADHEPLTIRKLACRSKLGVWDREARFWADSKAVKQLQVCTGIVIKSSHKVNGMIRLDVPNRRLKIQVSFLPLFYSLVGSRFSEQSTPVEFFIGFNVERGAEAFSVKKLQQKHCPVCKLNTKIITLNQDGAGICSKCRLSVT